MINVIKLRRLFEAAKKDRTPVRFFMDLREALKKGEVTPDEFSLAQLFDHFVENGRELRDSFDPKRVGETDMILLESAGAIDTAAFANISGQLIYTTVLEPWSNPELIWNQLMDNESTSFSGERIPGLGSIGDMAQAVGEGEEYPLAGISEVFIDTPVTTKQGAIVLITKEAIFFDRTNRVLSEAARVSDYYAVNKEKRCLDAAFGITTIYKRNGAAAAATYGDSPFDNLAGSNSLVNWQSIETAELLFDAMTDPTTGEPITVTPDTIVVPTALKHTAKMIVNATMLRTATNTAALQTYSDSPISSGDYNVVTGRYVKNRTSSASTWFIGQPKKAFKYMMNWDITSVPMPPNSYMEWSRDVVAGYKVSERGTPAVIEPRYMVKCT